jgi:hypothetical protein
MITKKLFRRIKERMNASVYEYKIEYQKEILIVSMRNCNKGHRPKEYRKNNEKTSCLIH